MHLFDPDFIMDGLTDLLSVVPGTNTLPYSSNFAEIASLESTLYLKNQLLRDTDWCSMHHSLEVRTPFVDYTLLRSLAPVLSSYNKYRFRPSKLSLTNLSSERLPESITKKAKTGFNVPLNVRLKSIYDFVPSSVLHKSELLNSPIKRYAYLVSSLFF